MNLPNLASVFASTWRTSLQSCLLIVVVLLIQALAGKSLPARFRYALSLLVLLRLIVLVTPASNWSVFILTRHVRPLPQTTPVHPVLVLPLGKGVSSPGLPPPDVTPISLFQWRRWAAWAWICGGAVSLLTVFWRHRKFARWVAKMPAESDPRLLELVDQCKTEAGVKGAVRIVRAPGWHTAAVFGYQRPCLLLPERMLDTLERREVRLVLLHEFLHIRRRDVLVSWFRVLALALHWFNPLAWVAMRRLRMDQELACDAAVLALVEPAEHGTYGRTLLKHLQNISATPIAVGLVPLITTRNNIKRRIIMITEFKRTGGLARVWFALLLVALGGLTFTRAAEDPVPTSSKTDPPLYFATTTYADKTPVAAPTMAGQDYGAEYLKQSTLLEKLKELKSRDHDSYIQALSVTASDPILNSLLAQKLEHETKLASIERNSEQAVREQLAIRYLNGKIDQRADGIIAGMSIQSSALKAVANDRLLREPKSQDILSKSLQEKSLQDWDHQRVNAEADYLEYSNIMYHLNTLPTNQLSAALNTAYAHQLDPELIALGDHLQTAKARMVDVQHAFGRENPSYQAAEQQLKQAEQSLQKKVDGVMAGIKTRVGEDEAFLKIVQAKEDEIIRKQQTGHFSY